jgi:hypothetical protein
MGKMNRMERIFLVLGVIRYLLAQDVVESDAVEPARTRHQRGKRHKRWKDQFNS